MWKLSFHRPVLYKVCGEENPLGAKELCRNKGWHYVMLHSSIATVVVSSRRLSLASS